MSSKDLARLWKRDRSLRRKTEATQWYPDANAWAHRVAREHGVSPVLVVDLVAVLSPRVRWDVNKFDAEQVLCWGAKHKVTTWPVGRKKALALLDGYSFADLVSERTSPKVWNFRNNIANPLLAEYVTIDRWIARAHGQPERVHYGRYQALAALYRETACNLGILPNVLQAYMWIKTRNAYRFAGQEEIPF